MNYLKTVLLVLGVGHLIAGLYGLYSPLTVANMVSLEPLTGGALGEMRAAFGGLIVAMGAIFIRGAFGGAGGRQWLLAASVAYAGLFIGRVVSLGTDGVWAHTLLAGLIEGAMAGILVYAGFGLGKPASLDGVDTS